MCLHGSSRYTKKFCVNDRLFDSSGRNCVHNSGKLVDHTSFIDYNLSEKPKIDQCGHKIRWFLDLFIQAFDFQ